MAKARKSRKKGARKSKKRTAAQRAATKRMIAALCKGKKSKKRAAKKGARKSSKKRRAARKNPTHRVHRRRSHVKRGHAKRRARRVLRRNPSRGAKSHAGLSGVKKDVKHLKARVSKVEGRVDSLQKSRHKILRAVHRIQGALPGESIARLAIAKEERRARAAEKASRRSFMGPSY